MFILIYYYLSIICNINLICDKQLISACILHLYGLSSNFSNIKLKKFGQIYIT